MKQGFTDPVREQREIRDGRFRPDFGLVPCGDPPSEGYPSRCTKIRRATHEGNNSRSTMLGL